MDKNKEFFFNNNLKEINEKLQILLDAVIFVPVVFAALTYIGVFEISLVFCLIFFLFNLVSILVYTFFNKHTNHYVFTSYLGIIIGSLNVAGLGMNSQIIITMSFGFFPLLSIHYFNRRFTQISLIIGYVVMVLSIIIKSISIVDILIFKGRGTSTEWAIPTIIGLTIEYFFFYLLSIGLASKTEKTLNDLLDSTEEKKLILEKLRSKNKIIEKVNDELEYNNKKLNLTQLNIVQFVAQVLGSHDLFTGRHVLHTQKYVDIICRELRAKGHYEDELTDENIELFRSAAFLHDIGKIHIPEGILNKVGKFTDEEFKLMKSHPEEGLKLLQFLPPIQEGKFNEIAKQMAYCHHEKWDGTGYPRGLKETQIPLCARIMAAADVLDALISERLYKEPMSIDEAMILFQKLSGSHFEPCITEAVIALKYSIEIIDSDFKLQENNSNYQEKEWWLKYHENLLKEQQEKAKELNF